MEIKQHNPPQRATDLTETFWSIICCKPFYPAFCQGKLTDSLAELCPQYLHSTGTLHYVISTSTFFFFREMKRKSGDWENECKDRDTSGNRTVTEDTKLLCSKILLLLRSHSPQSIFFLYQDHEIHQAKMPLWISEAGWSARLWGVWRLNFPSIQLYSEKLTLQHAQKNKKNKKNGAICGQLIVIYWTWEPRAVHEEKL